MAEIFPRKSEMEALYLPAAPEGAAFRQTAEGFLQLKDSADGQFRSLFLNNGELTTAASQP